MVMPRKHKSYRRVVKSARKIDNKNSSGGLFSKWLITFVCLMIIGYLIVDIICGFKIGQFLPDVLTTSWFAFWAVELINLVVIKRGKLRAQYPDLIEEEPQAIDINLRAKEDFGNFSQQVQDVVNNANSSLQNPLPVEDNIFYDSSQDSAEEDNSNNTETTFNHKGGNSSWEKLIS